MKTTCETNYRWRAVRWIAALALLAAQPLHAHAILKRTVPAANGSLPGPDVVITLQFNVRIDAKLSRVSLLNPDNSAVVLKLDPQKSADTLISKAAGLKPGLYRIRWQVLAPDGHITRGEIPFSIAAN